MPIRSISSPSRVLSSAGWAYSLGRTPLSVGFSFSIVSMAASRCLPISGRLGGGLRFLTPGLRRHPEDVLGRVLVPILRVGVGLLLECVVTLLEGVGDVLEEDPSEGD